MSYVPTFTNDAELDALIASMLADIAPAPVAPVAPGKSAIARAAAVARSLPVVDVQLAKVDAASAHGLPVFAAPAVRAPRFWNVSWRKVGGLTFVRVGRLSVSFCLTRKPV